MPRAPPPPINEARMDVVQAAWHKIANGDSSCTVDELKVAYDASRHPRVLDGVMAVGQAKEVVARAFDTVPDGKITWEEFLAFHVKMSHEVDRSRSVDRDGTFVQIVVQQWRLDRDPEAALQPTGIVPTTLDCPRGLKQTKNMDLVWPTDDGNKNTLLGFRGSVKTRFARAILPPEIRGHFAFADELSDFTVKSCQSRSALMHPLSIVWVHADSGTTVGIRGVLSQNVDIALLPATLRPFIVTEDDATKRTDVEWLPLEAPYNPMYKKSSEAFGEDATSSAQQVLALKKKVFDGTACGVAWHGHTGKFTDSFNGGPTRASGLNTAARKAAV